MARLSTFDLIDESRFDGKLADLLRAQRHAKRSLEDIVVMLATEHDVRVSASTVRRWLDRIDDAA